MRLYYVGEAEGPHHYVSSALGVDAERWNNLSHAIRAWRVELRDRYGIPTRMQLHACDPVSGTGQALLAGRGKLARRLVPEQGAEVFASGLRLIESAARKDGIDVINVCLRKTDIRDYERVSLDRLLNRINTSVASDDRHAFLIFDEGREKMVTELYRRLRGRNHVPSRYETWEDGGRTKDIPIERVIGGPAFRSSKDDRLLQMADLIGHALLKQEEQPSPGACPVLDTAVERLGLAKAFSILDLALNRRASRGDPQGVVRR